MHVKIDAVTNLLPDKAKKIFTIVTRLIGVGLFVAMACALIMMGNDLKAAREVSAVLKIPFYPVAYAISVAFFVQVALFIVEIVKGGEQKNE